MANKILPILFTAAICAAALFSCKKNTTDNTDQTLNYFPVKVGKSVTYNVDSIVYSSTCFQYETRTQLKYVISDTFRDSKFRLSYIMDVYSRPNDGGEWWKSRVILLTPATIVQTTTAPPPGTPLSSLLYNQDGSQFVKLVFPILQGLTWQGNANIITSDPAYAYLKNWTYSYQDLHKSYNDGYVNYDNTVTVLEDNESVNYPHIDSALYAYRIYAKEVYAWNVGMVYKEWTHWDYLPINHQCVSGYTVTMRAVDHN